MQINFETMLAESLRKTREMRIQFEDAQAQNAELKRNLEKDLAQASLQAGKEQGV